MLERGFAPRFLLTGSVSKPQLKKGHLWLTLTDGEANINAVVWSSQLSQIRYQPSDGDGVLVVGKLNFWNARATLSVNILDIRPNLSTVLKKFEIVKNILIKEGVINNKQKKILPSHPQCIAILTSKPSSALADMLITAKERWPLTRLIIIPIPVQGNVASQIQEALKTLCDQYQKLKIEIAIIARGGGNREDLMVFDDENLCREIARFPIPLICGLGHEDDITVADLVADYRAATPTAAIVAALPNKESAKVELLQKHQRLNDYLDWFLQKQLHSLKIRIRELKKLTPLVLLKNKKTDLMKRKQIIQALSPDQWLRRGFLIVRNELNQSITSIKDVHIEETVNIQLKDGIIKSKIKSIHQRR